MAPLSPSSQHLVWQNVSPLGCWYIERISTRLRDSGTPRIRYYYVFAWARVSRTCTHSSLCEFMRVGFFSEWVKLGVATSSIWILPSRAWRVERTTWTKPTPDSFPHSRPPSSGSLPNTNPPSSCVTRKRHERRANSDLLNRSYFDSARNHVVNFLSGNSYVILC